MGSVKPTLTVTIDRQKEFNDYVKSLAKGDVLVGIPESETARKDYEENGVMNNATLLAINEFGSPVNNIPPRTPMGTGINLAQDAIAEQFKLAAVEAWDKGQSAIVQRFDKAGLIASQAVKNVINQQINMDEPADSTLKSRASKGFKGIKALLVTGQMRNAITWVNRARGK